MAHQHGCSCWWDYFSTRLILSYIISFLAALKTNSRKCFRTCESNNMSDFTLTWIIDQEQVYCSFHLYMVVSGHINIMFLFLSVFLFVVIIHRRLNIIYFLTVPKLLPPGSNNIIMLTSRRQAQPEVDYNTTSTALRTLTTTFCLFTISAPQAKIQAKLVPRCGIPYRISRRNAISGCLHKTLRASYKTDSSTFCRNSLTCPCNFW